MLDEAASHSPLTTLLAAAWMYKSRTRSSVDATITCVVLSAMSGVVWGSDVDALFGPRLVPRPSSLALLWIVRLAA